MKKVTKIEPYIEYQKDIYKTVPFGEKGALKFIDDLEVNLAENAMYQKNYDLNYTLTSFDAIPDNITKIVMDDYHSQKISFNAKGINDFLIKYNLGEILKNVTDFYVRGQETEGNLDDFF